MRGKAMAIKERDTVIVQRLLIVAERDDVWLLCGDDGIAAVLVVTAHHVVHARQESECGTAIVERVERRTSFMAADRIIGRQTDHQAIAETLGFTEKVRVARMHAVEGAEHEYRRHKQ